jgi:hypothetical protein
MISLPVVFHHFNLTISTAKYSLFYFFRGVPHEELRIFMRASSLCPAAEVCKDSVDPVRRNCVDMHPRQSKGRNSNGSGRTDNETVEGRQGVSHFPQGLRNRNGNRTVVNREFKIQS